MSKARITCKVAIENAVGYVPEAGVVKRARIDHRQVTTPVLKRVVRRLATRFRAARGRDVNLAEQLDAARIALALRACGK